MRLVVCSLCPRASGCAVRCDSSCEQTPSPQHLLSPPPLVRLPVPLGCSDASGKASSRTARISPSHPLPDCAVGCDSWCKQTTSASRQQSASRQRDDTIMWLIVRADNTMYCWILSDADTVYCPMRADKRHPGRPEFPHRLLAPFVRPVALFAEMWCVDAAAFEYLDDLLGKY